MTRVGRLAALIAIALTVLAIATWNESTQPTVSEVPPIAGSVLFKAKGCASCHIGPDSSSGNSVGPPLTFARDWAGNRRPGLSAAQYLAESMRTPSVFISPALSSWSGATMPNLNLSETEITALVEYLLR